MRVVCISASNVRHAGQNSTSLRLCRIIERLVLAKRPDGVQVETIPLVEHELTPCTGCGGCYRQERCAVDEGFNAVFGRLAQAGALFIVSAHYAPIPAKLAMLLEKTEQLAFLKRFQREEYRSPLFGKPVGIVAHGGGTQEIIPYYRGPVLDTIRNALSYPVEMHILDPQGDGTNGVLLPVARVTKDEHSPFPVQEYDWADLERRLEPLVSQVLARLTPVGRPTGAEPVAAD